MANLRTIPYGYKIENGIPIVVKSEAETVKRVFSLYIAGETLKKIADILTSEEIPYYQNEVRWNKNTINRMIENIKYVGEDYYPKIISRDIFDKVTAIKNFKGCKQEKHSDDIEHLRKICFCAECGNRYKRINKWGSKEKWLCNDGCNCSSYIDDTTLRNGIKDILNLVVDNPELLNTITYSKYVPTQEVIREENELSRLLEQPKVSFSLAVKSILNSASLRFTCCCFDKGEQTQALKEAISKETKRTYLDIELLKKYIAKVKITNIGKISVVFINNAEINIQGAVISGSITEDSNKNTSKSFVG